MIQASGLCKSYGGVNVVDDLSLRCERGRVLGLLGPNGAGKTTTLRMLYGLLAPDAGSLRYDGRDFLEHRTELKRRIGVCTQEDTLDYDFTVRQNLDVYGGYFRPPIPDLRRRVESLIDEFELREHCEKTPSQLSGGYKRRLLIARSVVHEPDVLFLDEPTTGLDPKARLGVWELVHRMRERGMAVVLTTHYMDEAERLSDELTVLSRGRDIAHGPPREVIGALLGDHVVVVSEQAALESAVRSWLRSELPEVQAFSVLGEFRIPLSTAALGLFTKQFGDARFEVRSPNLDDLFLQLSEPVADGEARE